MAKWRNDICVSIMTGKLEGIYGVNTNPLSCGFCQTMHKSNNASIICKYCYSIRMLNSYRASCADSWSHNSQKFSTAAIPSNLMAIFKTGDLVRLSAHGELINDIHASNYMNMIKANPQTFFGFWTKRANLVKTESLPNANLIYSNPIINDPKPKLPKGFDKIFTVYTEKTAKEKNIGINCKGSKEGGCKKCMLCYTKNNVSLINEVIKPGSLK